MNSSSTFTFGLAISDGTVVVNNANAVGTGPLVVNNGGTLNLFGTGTTNTLTLGVNNLPSGNSFTLNKGGILNLTLEGDGTSDAINAAAKGVSLAGTLQLDGTINYSDSYTLFTDFNTLSDSNLAIIGYDTTDYAAKLSSTGTLSFIPQEVDVPEPSTFPLFGLGLGVVGTVFYFRRVRSSAAL
ncbi:MAG: PEP-CTERM sorting domain-containing protein [Verrucomicrobiota bacterium]